MAKRRYAFSVVVEGVLECDPEVVDRVDDEWRKTFYHLMTEEQVVEMLAFNLVQERALSSLDGWGDCENSQAQVQSVDFMDWDVKRLP
jgi:hypothetical protein